jgi:hypothetical protein
VQTRILPLLPIAPPPSGLPVSHHGTYARCLRRRITNAVTASNAKTPATATSALLRPLECAAPNPTAQTVSATNAAGELQRGAGSPHVRANARRCTRQLSHQVRSVAVSTPPMISTEVTPA